MPTIMIPGKDKEEAQKRADEEERKMIAKQHADPNFLLCRHGEKDWKGSDPNCAFNDYNGSDPDCTFREHNWNCFLMNEVRALMGQWDEEAPGHYWWDEDQYYGVLYISSWINKKEVDSYLQGAFILLDWYKSRGATDSFRILQGNVIREGNEEDALEIVRLYKE